jgi:NADH-quinone oxidoreductase subunit J
MLDMDWSSLVRFLTDFENLIFLILAVLVIGGAVFMISFTRVVHMVISLAFTFLGLAGLYVILQAEFVAFVQILIYAGAVTILMIFGIMMTKHDEEEVEPKRPVFNYLLLIGIVGLFGILFFAIQQTVFPNTNFNAADNNTQNIGELLYTLHVIPFELVSLLLTVAFIGAIILAKREEE